MSHGDRTERRVKETTGISICPLPEVGRSALAFPGVSDDRRAGQGAHREVGSEGFEATRAASFQRPAVRDRAVAVDEFENRESCMFSCSIQHFHHGSGCCTATTTDDGEVQIRRVAVITDVHEPKRCAALEDELPTVRRLRSV